MSDIKQKYIALIQKRSEENEKAIMLLFDQNLIGNCIAILRQELDSFIRVMYLGRISDFHERERLMNQTLLGEKWSILTPNNKIKYVTYRDMVEKSTELKGYIQYVYKFGCAFIHLSDFHNYIEENPFEKLDYSEQFDIVLYLHQYHGFNRNSELTVENISYLIPNIFEKISKNLTCYFSAILYDGMIEM
ncbi:hypothetical protein M8998_05485 [Sphingobacterium sp. lm-10]|uniref:hypothetical protein n=1 Tax=Sphingobacterium sp. lm-10 TaxID=2944904 RepID=UPI0020224733|nr:hypothetical protein [Sphingobacterium sp. lm-10]MCL7987389.1 hypothetical protein [Sphingobacterium sp. lm-10]